MNKLTCTALSTAVLLGSSLSAHALDEIIRPYQSIRADGMGGVRMTTGFYDENFFSNPARVTANPKFRFSLVDVSVEGNTNLPDTVQKLTGGGDLLKNLGQTAGNNNHGRIQTAFPAFYIPAGDGKMAFAFGLLTSTQFNVDLRQSFQLAPQVLTDVGPALTVGRKFLENNALSVGVTGHLTYRLASDQSYSFIDLIHGRSLSPLQTGGQGAMADFDIGTTYELPFGQGSPFRYSVAAAIDNLLGGNYSNLTLNLASGITLLPPQQPRSYSFGFAARRASWWKLVDTTFALEMTDIGNNPNGGLFRTVHFGTETHLSILVVRAGINQGYWTAGVGLNLRFVTLDVASYGEELSLNPGGLEDRRYALKLAFQIQ